MDDKLVNILNEMAGYLSITQMKKLQEVLLKNCGMVGSFTSILFMH